MMVRGDSFVELPKHAKPGSVRLFFTSPPDIAELGLDRDLNGYVAWQKRALGMMASYVADDGFVVVSQTDRKIGGRVYAKHVLNINAMLHLGFALKDHKIVAFGEVGKRSPYNFSYQHCLIFTRKGTFERKGDILRDILVIEDAPFHGRAWGDGFVELIVGALSAEGDVVIDPFAGSGVVPRVAERMGRKGIGFEIEEGKA